MRLPASIDARLEREEQRLLRRKQAHENALRDIDAGLQEIDRVKQLIHSPQNGTRVNTSKILKGIGIRTTPTRKDMILDYLKTRRRGATRIEIAQALMNRHDIDISVDAVTVYLSQLKAAGLIQNDGGGWRAL
jgi:hypothetical protein